MANPRPGKLEELITFEEYSEASDGMGGTAKTWAAISPLSWAAVLSGSGREAFQEDRTNATSMVMFTIRNRTDINETMRVSWGGVNYNIREIKREGRRDMYLRVMAERGVSN